MKWTKIYLISAGSMLMLTTCNKSKLDQPALQGLDEAKIANKRGVEALLIGAYSLLDGISFHNEPGDIYAHGTGPSNWIYGSICGTEAYKGSIAADQAEIVNLETFKHISTNSFLEAKWKAIYAGIARSNTVLRVMTKATDILAADRKRIEAEARFLRAFYHFEAVKVWNRVPFVDETITYNAGNYHVKNDTIWGALEKDFVYAVENLPETQAAVGRANNFAAKAFLAKIYLFQRKYQAAKILLEDIISNGVTTGGKKYALMRYPDIFNLEVKNSEEHIFSTQMSVNDGAQITYENGFLDGGFNGNLGDEWNFPSGEGSVTPCCGFFQPSQYLVNHFKTNSDGLPDLDTFNDTDVKNDEGVLSTSPFVPYQETLDPRLDWTVGRRAIPYLDWGDHPGRKWIVNQDYGGPYSPKKNVFYKSQAGVFTFDGWSPMASAQNVNILRFADVLLWAAEVEAEIGDLNKAREYLNRVRRRAADPAGWVKKPDGSPAANYKVSEYTYVWTDKAFALKAIRYERMLELGMEGHRFFDLVRWGIAEGEINAYLAGEEQRSYLIDARFTKNKNEYFPLPQSQIDLSAGADGIPKMTQNPGYN